MISETKEKADKIQTVRVRSSPYRKEKKIHTKSKHMTHHNHENQKWHPAEELNGRLAMIGIVAALLNYAWTGQIIPGIW